MVFRLQHPFADTPQFKRSVILIMSNFISKRAIMPYEKDLNDYLLKNYNKNLKEAAMLLVNGLTLQNPTSSELVCCWMNTTYDKLASLITYGNGHFIGSTILRDAFKAVVGGN